MKKIYCFLIAFYSIQSFSQITISKDQTFGSSGFISQNFSASQEIVSSRILILPDHSILTIINGNQHNSIFKVKPNGTLDPTFGINGKRDFPENNFMNVVSQGTKFIVYFGPKTDDSNNPYEGSKIIRLTENGSLDTTFGDNGVLNEVTESINPQSLSVLVLLDESFIVSNSNSTNAKKFTVNGQLETSYGNNGEIVYDYHFPIGQSTNGLITTCDISSLSSSVYSFYDLYSLTTNTVLNLTNAPCHEQNGYILQNKTNLSTRMTSTGTVYSIFEYKNYPLPDFSRMVVINDKKMDTTFNGKGFLTSENFERYIDAGFGADNFLILSINENQRFFTAYSAKGIPLLINNESSFGVLSGDQIEMKGNYILVSSLISDDNQNMNRMKIEKFLISNDKLSTSNTSGSQIEIENPVKDFLNIKNADKVENFQLYNIEGRKIAEDKNFKNIPTSNLAKGNYILKIRMKNGELQSKKLIKN